MKRFLLTLTILLFCGVIASSQQTYKVISQKGLNVRSQPTTESQVLGSLKSGSLVTVYSIEAGWAEILYNNTRAYVSAKYISLAAKEDEYTRQSAKEKTVSQKESSQAPKPGDYIYMEGWNYRCGNVTMTSYECLRFLEENCPSAYYEYIESERIGTRCKTTAIILDCCIAAPLGAGIGCYVYNENLAGGILMGVCGLLAAASIPCWIVGTVKSNHALANGIETYNAQCGRRYAETPLELKLTTNENGVGLALKF